MMGLAAQAVGDGLLRDRPGVVPHGQPRRTLRAQQPRRTTARRRHGPSAFTLPWGYQSGAMFNNLVIFQQYCKKYGTSHDGLARSLPEPAPQRADDSLEVTTRCTSPTNSRREDYLTGRVIEEPLVIYDCDRPVNTCAAFIFTTAERAKDLRQKPIYVLNHAQTERPGPEHHVDAGRAPGGGSQPGAEDVGRFWASAPTMSTSSTPTTATSRSRSSSSRASSGTASNGERRTTSMLTTSGSKVRIRSYPAVGITEQVATAPSSTLTASSNSGGLRERGRSR